MRILTVQIYESVSESMTFYGSLSLEAESDFGTDCLQCSTTTREVNCFFSKKMLTAKQEQTEWK